MISEDCISTESVAPMPVAHDPKYWYTRMVSSDTNLKGVAKANREFFAQMLSSRLCGFGMLPTRLGLSKLDYFTLLSVYFPTVLRELAEMDQEVGQDSERLPEREEVFSLLMEFRAKSDVSETWIAEIVVAACMGLDHLWQDLGLWSRSELSAMLANNFPNLAKLNHKNMKWKKFIYKQLCERDGTYVCRAPSCDVCADYQVCFGPEE